MAIYPCDYAPHRFPQAQQSIYFTRIAGGQLLSNKLRLCPAHFEELSGVIEERMYDLEEQQDMQTTCAVCGADVDCTLAAKLYPLNQEARQFVVDLCATCLDAVAEGLHVASGRPLAAR